MKTLDFSLFFARADEIPSSLQLSLYGTQHLIWLGALLVASLIISFMYKALKPRQRSKFKKQLAWFIILFELLRQIIYIQLGRYEWGLLPLHLCGITEFTIFIYAYTNNKYVKESLYSLGIVGALMALLFADWLIYPVLHFQSIHSFVQHGALFTFVLMLLVSGELRPNARHLPVVFMGLVLMVIPIYFLNHVLNTNFFFVNYPSPGSPLVLFEQIAGNPGYIALTIGLLLVVWIVMYLPFKGSGRKRYKEAGPLPVRRSV